MGIWRLQLLLQPEQKGEWWLGWELGGHVLPLTDHLYLMGYKLDSSGLQRCSAGGWARPHHPASSVDRFWGDNKWSQRHGPCTYLSHVSQIIADQEHKYFIRFSCGETLPVQLRHVWVYLHFHNINYQFCQFFFFPGNDICLVELILTGIKQDKDVIIKNWARAVAGFVERAELENTCLYWIHIPL